MAKWANKEYIRPTGICIVAGYSLHLYCANEHPYRDSLDSVNQAEIGGKTKAKAFKTARNAGWLISEQKDVAICPQCAKVEK